MRGSFYLCQDLHILARSDQVGIKICLKKVKIVTFCREYPFTLASEKRLAKSKAVKPLLRDRSNPTEAWVFLGKISKN